MPLAKDTSHLLSKLRSLMQDKHLLHGVEIDAYIIPSSDAHGSEYLALADQRRAFISGFTGSAGTAVVTQTNAMVWTDGRYFLQASQELDSNWSLMREGLPETPSIGDWLVKNIPASSVVGVDARLYGADTYQQLADKLKSSKIKLSHIKDNLVDLISKDERVSDVKKAEGLILLDQNYVGRTTAEKLAQIREQLGKTDTDLTVITSLDDIAWTLNMRGHDIPFGAVFFSYLIVTKTSCQLFTNLDRLTAEQRAYLLKQDEFSFHEYDTFYSYYEKLVNSEDFKGKRIYLSSLSNNLIHTMVPQSESVYKDLSIVAKLKMIKNSRELELASKIHMRDSAVLCDFFYKLHEQFASNSTGNYFEDVSELNEYEVAEYLDRLRGKSVGFMVPSFETICGFGSNGAIIHYKPKQNESKQLERNDLLLVDSGGHYLDLGTTDVTRTVFLGDPANITDYHRECFTLVLKGHIQLALRVFPSGITPELLDSFARASLWQAGLDYRHGTGHGVGALLNVHELPIIANRKSVEFGGVQDNMIITNEPGYYENDKFGIRIENCYRTQKAQTRYKFGNTVMLKFEPLTHVPIQLELVDAKLLDEREIAWLNDYHKQCLNLVGPLLVEANKHEVYEWLAKQTRSI